MPPDAPASISNRRSRTLKPSRVAKYEPNPAPIWAIGPSRPAEPPVPMVMIDAADFTKGTRARILPRRRWKRGPARRCRALRPRAKAKHKDAADETTDRGHRNDRPRPRGHLRRVLDAFAASLRREVTFDVPQRERLERHQQIEEGNRAEPGDDADKQTVQNQSAGGLGVENRTEVVSQSMK